MLFSLNTRTPQRKKRVAEIVKQIKATFGNSVVWTTSYDFWVSISMDIDILGYVDARNGIFHIWNEKTRNTNNEIKMDIPLKECDTIY